MIPSFKIDDLLIENICEHIMGRRIEFEPDDTPHWKDYVANPANNEEADKWRLHTRCALEAIQKFAQERQEPDLPDAFPPTRGHP